jgi:hypothetical protein
MTDIKPQLRALPGGAVLVLGDTGDIAADLYAAIGAAGARDRVPASIEELRTQLERREDEEAVYSMRPFVKVLWSGKSEQVYDDVSLMSWFVLLQTPIGDAVFWQTAVNVREEHILLPNCAFRKQHDDLMDGLRIVGGTYKFETE